MCARACVRACACTCVRACMCASVCVRLCVCLCACVYVWYGMVYLFFHRQYKVVSKQIASEMLPYTVNERRPPYNPKVVLPQLLYR